MILILLLIYGLVPPVLGACDLDGVSDEWKFSVTASE
jgi:hypothetical protein